MIMSEQDMIGLVVDRSSSVGGNVDGRQQEEDGERSAKD